MSTFEEVLEKDGRLVYKTRGVSMLPMLHQNRDIIVIVPLKRRLKKYDVVLYKRGSSYILHRIVGVRDEEYLIRGDNTYRLEHVPQETVIGVLTGFVRKHSFAAFGWYRIVLGALVLLYAATSSPLLIGGIFPAIVAGVLGPVFLRIKGVYFVLLTFAFGQIVNLILQDWVALTGGNSGIYGIPKFSIFGFRLTQVHHYYILALIFLVKFFLVA